MTILPLTRSTATLQVVRLETIVRVDASVLDSCVLPVLFPDLIVSSRIMQKITRSLDSGRIRSQILVLKVLMTPSVQMMSFLRRPDITTRATSADSSRSHVILKDADSGKQSLGSLTLAAD